MDGGWDRGRFVTLERKTPLKRTAMRRKPTRNASKIEFSPAIKAEVDRRAGGRCEAKTHVCTGRITTHHHRQMRGQGGMGTLENCLACCHACHVEIHKDTKKSYEMGWLIRVGPEKVDGFGPVDSELPEL